MDNSDATPISYMAVKKETPVLSAGGEQIGEVEKVLDDPSLDLFDGITVQTRHGLRFADRDAITEITDRWVKTTFASAADLPEPSGTAVYRPNDDAREKTGFVERIKDAFGDDKPGWERQKDET
jgi:hypothetical protein